MLRSGRNFSVRLFAVSVWLASLSQARGQNPQPDQSISIRGTVINSVTHEPIARAQVYSPDNRFAAMTDDQGHFEVTFPRASDAPERMGFSRSPNVLMARKPGFLAYRNGRGNVQVNSSTNDLTIPLIPEAILMGRIALDTTDSADGIQVQLFVKEVRDGLAHWSPRDVATTNSKGEFRFAELYAGDYRVGTHEVGDRDPADFIRAGKQFAYPPVYFPEASDFPSASTIHLSPGKVFEADFSLARRQYYPVKISVNNFPAGTFIKVNVSVRGDGAPGYSLGYNFADHTIRGGLPNGIYVVEGLSFSQPGATGLIDLRVANGPAESGQLTLLPNGTIPVRVSEEFTVTTSPEENHVTVYNGAVGGFHSRSQHQYLNVVLEPVSDFGQGRGGSLRPPRGPNDESLAIDNVQPGRYWVRVSTSRGYAASVTSGGLDLLHQPLIVGPGGSSSPIEITMRDDTASLDGTIEGADATSNASSTFPGALSPRPDTPFAYVYCIPQPDSASQFTQVWVSADGKFNSQQIPPGEYRVLAFKHQQNDLEYRNPKAMRAYESKGQVVSLVTGQKEHLQLELISKADEDAN